MSEMSNEAIQAQIAAAKEAAVRTEVGETITGGTASKPVYADSDGNLATGNLPFATTMAGVVVSGLANTATSAVNVTGESNPTVGYLDTLMTGQLVLGSNVTTWTKTGFIRVSVTDSTGNLTDGDHYLQIGTLT